MKALNTFLEPAVAEYSAIYKEMALAQWALATLATDENEKCYAAALERQRNWLADRQRFDHLARLMQEDASASETDRRQAVLLHAEMQANQASRTVLAEIGALEVEVQSVLARFRASVGADTYADNDVKQVLRTSADAMHRERVWCAAKAVGRSTAPLITKLAHLRNRVARDLGFRDFYAMSLALNEIDEDEMFALFGNLDRALQQPWQTFKSGLDAGYAARFGCEPQHLRPWHYEDPFFQEAPVSGINNEMDALFASKDVLAIAAGYFRAIGLNADDVLARSDMFERQNKDQHAFCTNIDRAGDIRILCNVRADSRWMETVMHELGHAVYEKYVDPALPWPLRTCSHLLATEGIAIYMGNLTLDDAWLAYYAGLDAGAAASLSRGLRQAAARQNLVFAKWVFVMSHFERALYDDPDQNLNALWYSLVGHHQNLSAPERHNEPDWASKVHFGIAPVYYHNYLMGSMVASQLRAHLHDVVHTGDSAAHVRSPKTGRALIDLCFRSGALHNWRHWIHACTGRDLSAATHAEEISANL